MSSRPVIIDCDPGTDDAIALFLALASPELEVRLVTVAGGNAGLAHTLANARAVVGLTGRAVPVVAGADRPLLGSFTAAAHVHGADGINGVVLPDGPPAALGVAADAIRDALRSSGPDGVTLVGIGPATNLALALACEPVLAAKVREVVLMTGAWAEGNVTPAAEFNAWSDPEALAVVFACGRPITVATLELTAQALCTPARLVEFQSLGESACSRAAAAILTSVPMTERHGERGHPQHDACAVMWLVAPALFTVRPAQAEVELGGGPARGRTVIDRWAGRPNPNISLLDRLDADGFFRVLRERVATLP